MYQNYPEPAAALISYGEPRSLNNTNDPTGWPDYVKELDLSLANVPHLIRMLNDPTLQHTKSAIWADVHAWRALGQLGAVDAIADLIHCLDYDDEDEVSDWTMEEIPMVLGKIGVPCIEPLSHYLNDGTKARWSLTAATEGLVCIAKEHPESRPACIAVITQRLERYLENDEMLNGFLICDLMNLKAVESLEVIRYAFQADAVDISIGGDLEDVEISLGVRQARSTPRPHYHTCGIHCHPEEEKVGWVRNSPKPQSAPKIGRNDPCFCGSGKKYKKCCLA